MVSLSMSRNRLLPAAALGLLLGASMAAPGVGQELPWLKGGQVRLDFAPSFWAWDSRFGLRTGPSGSLLEETEPLGMELNADPLGSDPIPYLEDLETHLRDALRDGTFDVRLGAGHSIVEQSRLTFPFRLDVGVTDWLTVGAMVPFHRPRTEIDFFLDPDSTNANVGLSPQLTSESLVARFVDDFQSVLDAAQAQTPGDPDLQEARGYLNALAAAYSQASLFPISGSNAGTQLQARLDYLRSRLEARGLSGIPQEVPLAQEYLDQEAFNAFLNSWGMRAYPLEDWTKLWSVGDIEITADARVLQRGFEPDSLGVLPALRYQLGVGALVRLGTGNQADPDRFFDLDPADGQTDMEGSVFGMMEFGRWVGAWGRFRYGIQQEGSVVRRIAGPSQVLPDVFRRAPLNWTPGDYLDLELSPRFYFTPEMTFGVRYRLWHKRHDSYGMQPIDSVMAEELDFPPTSLLELETQQTLHELAFTATYSTVAASARGETALPMMIRFAYFHPLAGSGGQTPKGGRLQVGLSLFRTFWGGDEARENEEGGEVR
ncbi:MAG: hypothetical protein R6T96_03890 [Longimicrobiales bacterium]